jgi:hypothetical protein
MPQGVNRYFTPAQRPENLQPYELPFNELYAGINLAQEQANQNREYLASFRKPFSNLGADDAKAVEQIKWMEGIGDKLIESYGNDPRNWNRGLVEIRNEMSDRFGPRGAIGAMQANYNKAAKEFEAIDKWDAPENVKQREKARLQRKYYEQGGVGTGAQDELGITRYNSFPDSITPEYINVDDRALEIAKNIPLDKWAYEQYIGADGKAKVDKWAIGHDGVLRKQGGKGEVVSREEIRNKTLPFLQSDEKLMDWVTYEAGLDTYLQGPSEGLTPEESLSQAVQNRLLGASERVGSLLEQNNSSTTRGVSFVPEWYYGRGSNENSTVPLTTPVLVHTKGSPYKNPEDIKTSRQDLTNNIKHHQNAFNTFLQSEVFPNVDAEGNIIPITEDGRDLTDRFQWFKGNIEQAKRTLQDLEDYDSYVRGLAGVDEEIVKNIQAKVLEDFEVLKTHVSRSYSDNKERYDQKLLERLEKKHSEDTPEYQEYKRLLKENSEGELSRHGVRTFGDKTIDGSLSTPGTMQKFFVDHLSDFEGSTLGAKWADGEPLSASDYKDLNPKEGSTFLGYLINDGELKLMYRAYDEDKEGLSEPIVTKAPMGIVENLVNVGDMEAIDYGLSTEIDKVPLQGGKISYGIYVKPVLGTDIQTSQSEKLPANTKYVVRTPGSVAPVHYSSKSAAIEAIKQAILNASK